jgi:hypothetical protein
MLLNANGAPLDAIVRHSAAIGHHSDAIVRHLS